MGKDQENVRERIEALENRVKKLESLFKRLGIATENTQSAYDLSKSLIPKKNQSGVLGK